MRFREMRHEGYGNLVITFDERRHEIHHIQDGAEVFGTRWNRQNTTSLSAINAD